MTRKINFKHTDEQLKKAFKSILAYDLAIFYPNLDDDEKKRMLTVIGLDKMSDMFVELDFEDQLDMLLHIDDTKKRSLFRTMESDDLKAFIEENSDEDRAKIFESLSKVKAKTMALLLAYEEDTAASIMSTDYLTVSIDDTIKQATDFVIRESREQDYIDTVFVVDSNAHMVGLIDIKDLIIARSNTTIKKIMFDDFKYVHVDASIERAIQTVVDYNRNAIPVLDYEHHIVGIVTANDIFDEILESTESDYQKMALLSGYESTSGAWTRSKTRLPWLLIAVVLNLLIASFLSIFEATLIEVAAIILFQPLILDMAGNIGTQALAVTIIGIHKNEFDGKSMPRHHVNKEFAVGLINSLVLGVAAFIFVTTFLTLFPSTGAQAPYQMGLVVFVAIFSSMLISALMGVFIPILLHKYKQDPAAASGPLMTTINDLVALVIYFGVATLVFL